MKLAFLGFVNCQWTGPGKYSKIKKCRITKTFIKIFDNFSTENILKLENLKAGPYFEIGLPDSVKKTGDHKIGKEH